MWQEQVANIRQKRSLLIAFVAVSCLFCLPRAYYWLITDEAPFSDMQNFAYVGSQVYKNFAYGWNSFWLSYNPPTLPSLRAIQILLSGEALIGWQIFQALITFAGLIWLAREIYQLTRSRFLQFGLLIVVALSKSSIFWSYKLSREGIAEAFLYLFAASWCAAMRSPSNGRWIVAGLLLAAAFLNRANLVLLLPIVGMSTLLPGRWLGSKESPSPKRRLCHALLFSLAVLVLWLPWIARSVRLYGQPVLISTQGPYSFFWEWGEVEVTLPGESPTHFTVDSLQRDALKNFKNDYEAYSYAKKLMNVWMAEHWQEVAKRFWQRIPHTLASRDICLTKVSREDLFPNALNSLLLDKSLVFAITGLVGLLLLPFVARPLVAIPLLVLVFWLSALPFIGYPRVLEAAVPLILWGNLACLYLLSVCGLKKLSASAP